jgi:hypothetical protein
VGGTAEPASVRVGEGRDNARPYIEGTMHVGNSEWARRVPTPGQR